MGPRHGHRRGRAEEGAAAAPEEDAASQQASASTQDFTAAFEKVTVAHTEIVDDLVLAGFSADLDDLEPLAATFLEEVARVADQFALRLNWKPGKSELVFAPIGPGAAQWGRTQAPGSKVSSTSGAVSCLVTPLYVHVGSGTDAKGSDAATIRGRCAAGCAASAR